MTGWLTACVTDWTEQRTWSKWTESGLQPSKEAPKNISHSTGSRFVISLLCVFSTKDNLKHTFCYVPRVAINNLDSWMLTVFLFLFFLQFLVCHFIAFHLACAVVKSATSMTIQSLCSIDLVCRQQDTHLCQLTTLKSANAHMHAHTHRHTQAHWVSCSHTPTAQFALLLSPPAWQTSQPCSRRTRHWWAWWRGTRGTRGPEQTAIMSEGEESLPQTGKMLPTFLKMAGSGKAGPKKGTSSRAVTDTWRGIHMQPLSSD